MAENLDSREVFPTGLPLPPSQADAPQSPKTPVIDRSFFVPESHGQGTLDIGYGTALFPVWQTPRTDGGHGLVTPTDETTGLPIPIVPIDPRFSHNGDFSDYHHLFHPRIDLVAQRHDADVALRKSFGQQLPRWLHEHYHRYFSGPVLPTSRQQKFTTVVLACAGVVPRSGLLFTRDGPFLFERVSEEQYAAVGKTVRHEGLQNPDQTRQSRNDIGKFFANYALEQSFHEAFSDGLIDEFLNTPDAQRRRIIGNLMIKEAIERAVDPVRPVHAELVRSGLLIRRPTALPALVHDFFVRARRPDYFQAIDKTLLAA